MPHIRIFFNKTDEAAYISHLDLQRLMGRALRVSGLPVWYTQGYNPRIYLSFSLPLALFQESVTESVNIKLAEDVDDFDAYIKRINKWLSAGIQVTNIAKPVHHAKEITAAEYSFTVPQGRRAATYVDCYNNAENAMVVRETKRTKQDIDLKKLVPLITLETDDTFSAKLPAGNTLNYNPLLLMEFFADNQLNPDNIAIKRQRIFIEDDKPFE